MNPGETPFSNEFALVLACLHWPHQATDGERIRLLAQQPIHWPHLLDIVQQHKVTPMVARCLEAYAGETMPEGPATLLRNGNIENAHTCLRRITHLLALMRKFQQQQIPVRIFKGIPLAMMLFQDPTLRDAGDIDLLVSQRDVFAAGELLRAEGFVRFQPQGRITPRRLRSYIAHQKDFSYAHPTAGIVIDLHWRLFRNPWLPANAAIEQIEQHWVELSTEALPTLPLPRLLVYLCVHGALDGWLRLKWLADIVALLHAMTEEERQAAAEAARAQNALPQLSAAIYLCQDLLGYPAPAPEPWLGLCLDRGDARVAHLIAFSRRAMTSNHECPVREQIPSAQWFLNEFRQHDSWPYRLDLLTRSLFRPRIWSAIPLPDWLFPLYVVLSPLEWIYFHVRQSVAFRRRRVPQLRWWRRPPADLLLALEAAYMLGFFRLALSFLPAQKLLAWMSRPAPPALPPARDFEASMLQRIEWSIAAVVRHAPLTFVCFPQCLAAYFMLRRRRIGSTLFYGVMREQDQLKAHTWVKVGDRTVVGGEEAAGFTVLTTFP